GTAVYVLAVAPDVAADVGLGLVNVERGDVPRNARVAVSSEVVFTGPAERLPPSVTVEFWVDGKLRDRRGVERPEGGGPARVAFSTSFETEGFHQGRLVLRGGSRLPPNDRRHFTVRVRQLPRVVLARAESSDGAQAVAKVVEAALAPAGLKAAGKHTVDVRALPVEAVDDEVLKSCEVVIVTGSARGADGLWRRLRDFTARGGSVLVIPSAPDGAKERIASFYNSPRAQAMLPVRVTGIRRPEEPAMLDPRGYRDAVLAEFHGGEDGDLTVPAFMKYVRVKPLLGSEIRLRFSGSSGGEPAIVEGGVGAGSVLFVTFSPHPEWSNLSSQPEVVVLMHSLVRHMAQREAVRYNFVSGAPISVALPKGRAGAGSPLAAGLEIIFPDGSRRPAGADGPVVVVVGAEPALPGNYTIVDAAKAAPVAAISIDVPHEETDLSPAGRMRASELAGYFSPGTLRVAGDAGELARASADLRLGHDLAPILVLLLAAVLLAEGFLANRFYRCARDRNAG
ncbi:MAG: hypothetical protein QGD94_11145, partial [Planctomycetia bacterium]|nr:hypothetical protein [Planctomycetia bacterium]